MNCRKLVLYIAASLDGYIATTEHKLDWLFAVAGEGDNGYSKFYETVDTVLLGRVTYDWIVEHGDGEFPYRDKECFVFSRTPREDTEHVKFIHQDIIPLVRDLKGRDGKHIWLVSGGELLALFLREKLIDELTVTVAPILLGDGIPLFRKNDFPTPLSLKSIQRRNQFAELHYEVVR